MNHNLHILIFIPISIILIVIVHNGNTAFGQPAGWLLEDNTANGFKIQYEHRWTKVYDSIKYRAIEFTRYVDNPVSNIPWPIKVYIDIYPNLGLTFDEIQGWILKTSFTDPGWLVSHYGTSLHPNLTTQETTTNQGDRAGILRYWIPSGQLQYDIKQFYTLVADRIYVLSFVAPKNDEGVIAGISVPLFWVGEPTFDYMTKTFCISQSSGECRDAGPPPSDTVPPVPPPSSPTPSGPNAIEEALKRILSTKKITEEWVNPKYQDNTPSPSLYKVIIKCWPYFDKLCANNPTQIFKMDFLFGGKCAQAPVPCRVNVIHHGDNDEYKSSMLDANISTWKPWKYPLSRPLVNSEFWDLSVFMPISKDKLSIFTKYRSPDPNVDLTFGGRYDLKLVQSHEGDLPCENDICTNQQPLTPAIPAVCQPMADNITNLEAQLKDKETQRDELIKGGGPKGGIATLAKEIQILKNAIEQEKKNLKDCINNINNSSGNNHVTIGGNHAPIAENQVVTTNINQPVEIALRGSDQDNDILSAHVIATPFKGTLSLITTEGTVTYDPNLESSGIDRFTYVMQDGKVDSNVATVTIKVIPEEVECPPDTTRDINGECVPNIPRPIE